MSKIKTYINVMGGMVGASFICLSTDFIASVLRMAPRGTSWLMFPLAFILAKGMFEESDTNVLEDKS